MLDDDDGRRSVAKLADQLKRRISVIIIVIGQLFALHLFGLGNPRSMRTDRHIQRRALMRVFAITQFGFAISVHGKHIGEQLLLIRKSEPLADHAVICRGRRIGFGRTFTAEVIACFAAAFLQLRDQIIIIGWVGKDRDICMVLRGAAHH